MDTAWKVVLMIIAGHLGLVGHYVKSFLRVQTQETFVRYFFVTNVKASLNTYFTYMLATEKILTQVESSTPVMLFVASFTAGFSIIFVFFSDLVNVMDK